jgi:hypothetical protein
VVAAPLALAPHSHARTGGPITPLVIVAILGAAGWILGALCIGLWLGERGRRIAAERLATTGNPLGHTAARLPDEVDGEGRVASMGKAAAEARLSEATIRKGVEQLQREADAAGLAPLSDKDARQQVIAMLYGAGDDEVELPGLNV